MYAFINQKTLLLLLLFDSHVQLHFSLPQRTSPTRSNQTTTKNQEPNVSFKQKLTLLLNIPVIIIQS